MGGTWTPRSGLNQVLRWTWTPRTGLDQVLGVLGVQEGPGRRDLVSLNRYSSCLSASIFIVVSLASLKFITR